MGSGLAGSGGPHATVAVSAVEDLIQSLAGVESARIMVDEAGGIGGIHVLADASRNPKAIVRDIESGLTARWGLTVDHRRISVAQMGDAPVRPRWSRLRLQQLAVTNDPIRGWMEVAVSLTPEAPRDPYGRFAVSAPTTIWQGRAAGGSGHLGMRLAAEATLQALNQSLLPNHSFALGEAARVALAEHEVVLCLLHYHAPRGGGDTLTGSALVRNEAIEATVRAVLNASNRIYGVAARQRPGGSEEGGRLSGAPGPHGPGVDVGVAEVAAGSDLTAQAEEPPA